VIACSPVIEYGYFLLLLSLKIWYAVCQILELGCWPVLDAVPRVPNMICALVMSWLVFRYINTNLEESHERMSYGYGELGSRHRHQICSRNCLHLKMVGPGDASLRNTSTRSIIEEHPRIQKRFKDPIRALIHFTISGCLEACGNDSCGAT
jgi:hypothetical protein